MAMKHLLSIAGTALLAACTSTPDIRTDFDRTAAFDRYRSFNFVDEPTESRAGYETLLGKYIRAAVIREMEQRGYTLSDTPDLLVNYGTRFEEKTTVTPYTTLRPYYGYRSNRYRTWVGYRWETDAIMSEYTEGTLNIDIVDRERRQLVWEGVAIGRVTEAQQANREIAVHVAVAQIFERYPYQAGSATPGPTR